jgi:hypothetical protein
MTAAASGWVERSRTLPSGQTERWRERTIDAATGHVERVYSVSADRLGVASGTAALIAPGSQTTSWAPPSNGPQTAVRTVVMTATAREQLGRHHYDEGLEVGGACFGFFNRASGELVIEEVTGKSVESWPSSTVLDVDWITEMEDRNRAVGRVLVSLWHSHPSYGATAPSRTDERTWNSWAAHTDGPFVGLILSRSCEIYGWSSPVFSAYVANQRGFDQVPVEVESTWQ